MELKSFVTFRSLLCGLLAVFLLRTRRARAAAERAFSGNVITAIYFHNPGKKLFARCLSWLVKNGYTPITAEDLAEALQNKREFPRGAVWISLDDGYREWLHDLLPVIREYKMPVTLFIPTGIIEGDGAFPWVRKPKSVAKRTRGSMTVEELKQIAACPQVGIGGHTVTHTLTIRCTDEQLRGEIGGCKQSLGAWTGKSVICFSYPEGRYDGRERSALKEFDFTIAATTQPMFVEKGTDPLLVPRFCVPDGVTFPEAVCNMVGIWHPFLTPIKTFLGMGNRWQSTTPATMPNAVEPPKQNPENTEREEHTHVV